MPDYILILEDSPEKVTELFRRYTDRLRGKNVMWYQSALEAMRRVQLEAHSTIELWLDGDLAPGSGITFLKWVHDWATIEYLLVISMSPGARECMFDIAKANNIPYGVWNGPFG